MTVIGRHFSGCHATTGHATPAVHLPVQVGLAAVSTVSRALAKATTNASGYFKIFLTIPSNAVRGKTVTLAAASKDSKTTLAYAGTSHAIYTARTGSGSTDSGAGGGMPTGVPAGTGGLAATISSTDVDVELGLLAGGLLLVAGGGTVLARRRRTSH